MQADKGSRGSRERTFFLDAVRVLAAFLVVVNHTAGPYMLSVPDMSFNWWVALVELFACKPAVPMFVMVSGAVLLGKGDSYRKAASRLDRGAVALLLASALYYAVSGGELSLAGFAEGLWTGSIKSHLWYMYMYLGLLAMLPLMQRLAAGMSRKDCVYIVGASLFVSGIAPMAKVLFPDVPQASPWLQFPMFSAFVGMFFAGKLLSDVALDKRLAAAAAVTAVLCLLFLVSVTAGLRRQSPEGYLVLDDRTFAPIVLMAASIFYLLRHFLSDVGAGKVVAHAVTFASECSLGLYLSHILFRDMWVEPFRQACSVMPDLVALSLYQLVVFAAGLVVAAVLHLLPGTRRIF